MRPTADEDVYRRSFSSIHSLPWNAFTLFFFIVNSSVNAAGSSLKGVCWRKFHGKGIKLKIFRQCYVFRFCAVVIRYSRVEPKVPGLSPTQYLIFFPSSFFPLIFVFLFSISIYLNNCYFIKCNKNQEKYRVFRE